MYLIIISRLGAIKYIKTGHIFLGHYSNTYKSWVFLQINTTHNDQGNQLPNQTQNQMFFLFSTGKCMGIHSNNMETNGLNKLVHTFVFNH